MSQEIPSTSLVTGPISPRELIQPDILRQLRAEASLSGYTLWTAKNSAGVVQAGFLASPG